MSRPILAALAAAGLAAGPAAMPAGAQDSSDFTPAVVFDMGGKFDRSFNQGIYNGVEAFSEETGIDYLEFEVTNEAQREQGLRRMARSGASAILAAGFAQAASLEVVAEEFPEVRFTIIDAVVDLPNVQSVIFREQEGSFLVGMLAAMATETGVVGFVGGMDIPLIRAFACGYAQGVHHVDPSIEVLENMTGTTPSAWNDPTRGGELARSQFDRGADVVFAAAGGTGIGVYQAAADTGNFAIGVDSNQNYLHPGTMLTSMIKRVDVAANNAFASVLDGTWEPGVKDLGLAENGVGWALDEHNADLISVEMREAVEQARAAIVAGEIEVIDYRTDNACDY
jgi:basic membrane protein A